jgi:hypothetical protein
MLVAARRRHSTSSLSLTLLRAAPGDPVSLSVVPGTGITATGDEPERDYWRYSRLEYGADMPA